MNSALQRFDELKVDELLVLVLIIRKSLTKQILMNPTDSSNSSNYFDVKISLRTVYRHYM